MPMLVAERDKERAASVEVHWCMGDTPRGFVRQLRTVMRGLAATPTFPPCDAGPRTARASPTRRSIRPTAVILSWWRSPSGAQRLRPVVHARAARAISTRPKQELSVPSLADWQGALPAARVEIERRTRPVQRAVPWSCACTGAQFHGGLIASLSVPWDSAEADDLGGYHLVWPRDLVWRARSVCSPQGTHEEVRGVWAICRRTQEGPTALGAKHVAGRHPVLERRADRTRRVPILLVDLAQREQTLSRAAAAASWPMAPPRRLLSCTTGR